jgi:hypothetical protein
LKKGPVAETRSPAMSTRLATIITRQRKSRVRDLAFAAFVVLAGACSIATVSTAVQVATNVVSR